MRFKDNAVSTGRTASLFLITTINNNSNNNATIGNTTYDDSWPVFAVTSKDEGFISDQTLENFMAVFTWMMPVLCTLAVTFCIFNAAVYWQQRPARFALYLIAVDLGDGLCSLFQLLHSFMLFAFPANSYEQLVVKWYLAKYVGASCRRAAVCLNTIASLERFLAIAFPLKSVSRRVCAKPPLIIGAVFITSLGAHVYFAVEYKVVRNEAGRWSMAHTSLRIANPEAFASWSLVASSIFAYAPLVAIMVLNVMLVIILHIHTSSLKSIRHAGGKETSSSLDNGEDDSRLITVSAQVTGSRPVQKKSADTELKGKKENQTTKMVVIFSTVFFVMAFPRMLNSTARSILSGYGPKGKEKNLYNAISLLSQITSHFTETALFWVSLAYSRSFRRAVLRLPVARWICGRWLVKASLPATSSSDVSTNSRGSTYLSQ